MLLDPADRILVQGITGREASAMVEDMLAYGSRIVAGVTPGKGGQSVHGVPVFDTVGQALAAASPTVSVISVPAPAVLDAALEAVAAGRDSFPSPLGEAGRGASSDVREPRPPSLPPPKGKGTDKQAVASGGGIKLILIMSERVPRLDTSRLLAAANKAGCRVVGPNTLGLIRPGVAKLGTIGGRLDNVKRSFAPGRVAVLSRSGGMTTEIASFLTGRGIGQSIAVGVGGDPIIGCDFVDLIDLLEADASTDAVVLYGEPGGTAEERLADRLKARPSRLRINAFLSGRFVDDLEGVRFGHAAVIVEGGRGSVKGKAAALRGAGVFVAERFDEILEGLK